MFEDLLSAFSGPSALFMYLIAALLAYAIAVAVERSFLYWKYWKSNTPLSSTSFWCELLEKRAWGELQKQLGHHPASLLSSALQEASEQHKNIETSEACWSIMATVSPQLELQVRKRLSILGAIGNISTMLGLLGTVYGLIFALGGLDQASSLERTARLSEGIAAAMSTTAWGLLVGIPALALHAFLSSRAKEILSETEALAAQMALILPAGESKHNLSEAEQQ